MPAFFSSIWTLAPRINNDDPCFLLLWDFLNIMDSHSDSSWSLQPTPCRKVQHKTSLQAINDYRATLLRSLNTASTAWSSQRWSNNFGDGEAGSTTSTLLHEKINPKDWQVFSLGDAGFLQFFGLFQGIMASPEKYHAQHVGLKCNLKCLDGGCVMSHN